MAFIFEGKFDFRAIGIDFAVADNHVLFHDFGYTQLAQMFSGLLDFLAASSQVLVLVPMSSITLYVLSGWTTLWVLCAIAHSGRGTTMRLFDPLKKILVFFLVNAIAFVKADPNPPKLVQDLREQFDNLTVVL